MATTLTPNTTADSTSTPAAPTHLNWSDATGAVHSHRLSDGATTVGGGPRCVVRIDGSDVKPLHCVIQVGDAGVTIRRWSAGASLNGRPFTEAPLRTGDRLTIAGVELWTEATEQTPPSPQDGPVNAATDGTVAEEAVATATAAEDQDAPVASPAPAGEAPTASSPSKPEVSSGEGAFCPVPPRLMQPWLEANPEATPPVESSAGSSAGSSTPAERRIQAERRNRAERRHRSDRRRQDRDGVLGPSNDSSKADRRLRDALSTTRGRARSALAALRKERSDALQLKAGMAQAADSRHDLAVKLLLVTTELHDCRTDLEKLKAEFSSVSNERDDHHRLYELAKGEVDELEKQVAKLQEEQDSLRAEQSEWTQQREQLEAAIAVLEERVGQALAVGSEAIAAPAVEVEEASAANDFSVADSEPSEFIAEENTNQADPVEEVSAEEAFPEQEVVQEEAVEEAAAASLDQNAVESDAPAFDWGIESSPAESFETPQADEPVVDEPVVDEPVADESFGEMSGASEPTAEAAESPWSGVWAVEGKEDDQPSADPMDQSSDELDEAAATLFAAESSELDSLQSEIESASEVDVASKEEAPSEENTTDDAADSWLASFANQPAPQPEPAPEPEPEATWPSVEQSELSEDALETEPPLSLGLENPTDEAEADEPKTALHLEISEPTVSEAEAADWSAEPSSEASLFADDPQPEAGATALFGDEQATDEPQADEPRVTDEPEVDNPPSLFESTLDADLEKSVEPVEASEPVAELSTDDAPLAPGSLLEQAGILMPGALGEASDDQPEHHDADPYDADPVESEAAVSAPASVDELINVDQPSSEAPVSFIDQFADSLPADEDESVSFGGVAAEPPAPVEPATPSFAANDPLGSPAGEDEESIEDYMAKLMQRMRGDEDEPAATAKPALAALATNPATPTPAPAPEPPPEPVKPLTDIQEIKRGPTPEHGHDMSTLRALANETARDAIGVSEKKHNKEQAYANLAISVIAMGCGVFLAATTPSLLDGQLFGGVAAFGWAAYWFIKTLRLLGAETGAKAHSKAPTDASESLPITPEQD